MDTSIGFVSWQFLESAIIDHIQESYIFPLRDTFFEGQAAKIPYAYSEVLVAEYGKASLTNTHFQK
jgi:hypothetical protein